MIRSALVFAGALVLAPPVATWAFEHNPAAAKSGRPLDLTGADELIFGGGNTELHIAYRKVQESGQNVSRRYAAAVLISPVLPLNKSHKHFVTIGYEDANGKQQASAFRVEKGDIRLVLASQEARTGRRVEFLGRSTQDGKGLTMFGLAFLGLALAAGADHPLSRPLKRTAWAGCARSRAFLWTG
jgi:hypothetical protein